VSRFFVNERGSVPQAGSTADAEAVGGEPLAFHRSMPGYRPTRLVSSPELARRLGIASLLIKDESSRFGLPAFKVLGASWAVNCALADRLGSPPAASFAELREGAARLRPLTLVAATDGNHGRAVAHMAALLGFEAKIYVPAGTVRSRIDAIIGEGAEIEVVDGTYDQAVARSAEDADERHLVVSDTSWPGYHSIPRTVIDGYGTILQEADHQLAELGLRPPDLVLVQVGVGAFAAAVAAHVRRSAASPVCLVTVEPDDAACLLESLAAGRVVTVPGPHRSIMAGLNCGTPSLVAWPMLRSAVDLAIAVDDRTARDGMVLMAHAGVESGESGAAGLAGLLRLLSDPDLEEPRARLGVGASSSALVFSTEGATDPIGYAKVLAAGTDGAAWSLKE
jgi:diaminopropionate ammonia-lyase